MANVPQIGAPRCNTPPPPECACVWPFLRMPTRARSERGLPMARGGRRQPGVGEGPAGWVLSSGLSPRPHWRQCWVSGAGRER